MQLIKIYTRNRRTHERGKGNKCNDKYYNYLNEIKN